MTGGWPDDDADSLSHPSIWDAGDEDDALEALRLIDPDASPVHPPPRLQVPGPQAWLAAEAALARPFAAAAASFARFDERLRAWSPAHARAGVERLAASQASALLWAEGAPVDPERLTLWGAARVGAAAGQDARFARATWAARRLARGRRALPSPAALARLHGRRLRADEDDAPGRAAEGPWGHFARPRGEAWRAAAEAYAAELRGLRRAHPFTQACAAERAWARAGLSDAAAVVEPSVAAMTIAARAGRGAAPFAPLRRRRTPGGEQVAERLRAFCADIAVGSDEALAALERMQEWRARAEAGIADLSGRAPRLLVTLLAARVAVSAQEAADAAAVSVSAAARNLALLTERGLTREITGQGRFRMWTARH
jgi:hypothetical protein